MRTSLSWGGRRGVLMTSVLPSTTLVITAERHKILPFVLSSTVWTSQHQGWGFVLLHKMHIHSLDTVGQHLLPSASFSFLLFPSILLHFLLYMHSFSRSLAFSKPQLSTHFNLVQHPCFYIPYLAHLQFSIHNVCFPQLPSQPSVGSDAVSFTWWPWYTPRIAISNRTCRTNHSAGS